MEKNTGNLAGSTKIEWAFQYIAGLKLISSLFIFVYTKKGLLSVPNSRNSSVFKMLVVACVASEAC